MRIHHPPLLPPPILLPNVKTEQLRRTDRRRMRAIADDEADPIDEPVIPTARAAAAKPAPPPRPTIGARLADQTLGALLLGQELIQPGLALSAGDPHGADPGGVSGEAAV